MSKKRTRKSKPRLPPSPTAPPVKLSTRFSQILGVAVLITGVLGGGLVQFYKVLTPELVLFPASTLDPFNPFSTNVSITNRSTFSIANVHPILLIDTVHLEYNTHGGSSSINTMDTYARKVRSGETYTFRYRLDSLIMRYHNRKKAGVRFINMAYAVFYDYIGIERKELFFYKCEIDRENKAVWSPMSEQPFGEAILEERKRRGISNEFKDAPAGYYKQNRY